MAKWCLLHVDPAELASEIVVMEEGALREITYGVQKRASGKKERAGLQWW